FGPPRRTPPQPARSSRPLPPLHVREPGAVAPLVTHGARTLQRRRVAATLVDDGVCDGAQAYRFSPGSKFPSKYNQTLNKKGSMSRLFKQPVRHEGGTPVMTERGSSCHDRLECRQ